ncbi:MAG: YceI family protein [Chloroflexota bacterium]|nr:YceI family protein [Chloroflexota bacterium]
MSSSTLSTTAPITAVRSTWQIDPAHSLVEFSVRHMMVSTVKGRFTSVRGTITDVADDPTLSSVDIEIDAASLTTNDESRDAHLRSADFFDADRFPTITFDSTRVEGTRDEFTVTGNLSMRGVTREVTLQVTFNGVGTNPWGKTVAGFTAETRINRKDWGLNWNVGLEAGGVLVSDQVKISIEIEAIKDQAN